MKTEINKKRENELQGLNNFLDSIKERGHLISFEILIYPDKRALKFGLGRENKNLIDWLSFSEMIQFLRGFYFASCEKTNLHKTASASYFLQLMDKDFLYSEAKKQTLSVFSISEKQLNEDLKTWI